MSRTTTMRSQRRLIFCALVLALAPAAYAGVPGPTFSKVFTPDTIGPGSVSTITFTITNGTPVPVTDLAFTDVLPIAPGPMTIADPANASTDCDLGVSGSLTAPDGGSTITLSDAQIGGVSVCTVTVDVTASTPGAHTNPAITLTSSAGSSMSLPVDLTVDTTLLGFSKSFAPSSVALGDKSTLTFTIDNSSASFIVFMSFTDNLPAGMEVADPAEASTDCNFLTTGVVNAVAGTGVVSLSAGGVAAASTCTVTVDVVATGVGELDNVTGELTHTIGAGTTVFSAGKASATLEVTVTPVAIQKSFLDDPVPPGSNVTLEFRIDNFDRNFPATGVAFSDDLTTLVPALAGLTFDSLLSNDCGGSVSGVGGTTIGLSGGTIAAESFCTLSVSLSVPAGATPGTYTNTTGTVTATVDGSPVVGNTASDDLFVEPVPLLTKEFLEDGTLLPDPVVLPGDDVVLRFTVTNTSTTSMATAITFLDELTDGSGGLPPDTTSGFLPFPVTVSLPPTPNPPCGAGSSLALVSAGDERQALELTGGSLDPAPGAGATCTFDVTLTIPATFPPGTYLNTTEEITATVDGDTRIGDPASDTLTVVAAPSLSKDFSDDPVAPGGSVTLEFALSYPADASGDATAITFTDNLNTLVPPLAGLTVSGLPLAQACDPDGAGGDPGTGTLSESGGVLTFMGGTLSPGESCTFSATLDVPMGAAPGTYTNTTSGVGATVEGVAATSAAASDDLKVAGLAFTKEFLTNPVIAGDTTILRFTIDNVHPTEDATITFFTDNLQAELTGLAATGGPSVDTCGGTLSGTTFLIYTGGSVMSGMDCEIEVEVLVPVAAADDTYLNVTSSLAATQGGSVSIDPAVAELTVNSNLLQLSKAFTDDPVAPGDSVTLEFTLSNLDSAAASMVDFTDDLSAVLPGTPDLTFDSLDLNECGGTVSGIGTDMITVMGASVAGTDSCTIRVTLSVPASADAGIYPNTTSDVTGDIGGFAVTGDAASDDLEVIQLLTFSKSFDGPTTATGTATLTFTITNPGTDTATGISFTDDLDAVISGLIATSLPAVPCGAGSSITGIGFLTFTGGELPPTGGTCIFAVDVLVPASATAGTFPNTTSDLFQAGILVADPATADLTIEPPPTFAKVFMPDAILASGSSTLRFTIDNSASALAASSLAFTDNLPAGVVVATPSVTFNGCGGTLTATAGATSISLAGGSVGAGASCTIDVEVTSLVAGMHVNTTLDLTSTSGNSGTATDTLTVTASADLSATKTDGVTSATPGGSVVYTIVVANAGPSPDPSVTLSDTFPSPPLTCTYTSVAAGGASGNTAAGAGNLAETLSMPAGSSVTYTASCDIDADATGTLSNTATATTSINDPLPGNNSATDGDTVLDPEADLSVTKTDGVTQATPGGSVTYTIVASNAGPSDDPAATVADTFPADLTCTYTSVAANGASGNTAGSGDLADTLSMPAGSSVTYTVSCDIDADATGTLSNTATITESVTDPDTGNNSATDSDTVLAPEADLSVTKTDGVTSAVPGQTVLTYTIVASNAGPSDEPSAAVSDVFPAELTCTWTSVAGGGASGNTAAGTGDIADTLSLPAGSSVTYTATCTIDKTATGTLSNTATITASVSDPDTGNNSATDDDTVLDAEADLGITKDGPVNVTVGEQLIYTLTVTNNGPSAATGVTVDDPTPAGLTFVSATAPCAGGFPCALGTMGLGDEISVEVTFEVPADYAGASPIVNTATISSDAADPVPGNDSATAETEVTFDTIPPEVTGVTTAAGPLAECDTVRVPITAFQVTIEDDQSPIENAGDEASYLLLEAGIDRDFATTDCSGAAGDDVAIDIVSLSLTDTPPTAVASLNFPGAGLGAGLYRLLVCDVITDSPGNALDGDGDSVAGGDFVLSFFRADPLNLFANGHFDDCPFERGSVTLDPWVPAATPPNTITPATPGADDFESSPLSASARVAHSMDAISSLAQCVAVEAGVAYDLAARWRFNPPMGAMAQFEQTCEFFDAADCAGASLGSSSSATLIEDEGGAWQMIAGEVVATAGAVSALCDFAVEPAGVDVNFDLYLDGLSLTTDGLVSLIFTDGFESGDTSEWSSTTP